MMHILYKTEIQLYAERHSHQLLLLPAGGAVSTQRIQTAQSINQPPNTTLLQKKHTFKPNEISEENQCCIRASQVTE